VPASDLSELHEVLHADLSCYLRMHTHREPKR
jgi:hypothetical protein